MSQSERERALTLDLLNAAAKIRHWHDWGRDNEGMVVSHDSVFELWEARDKLKAALDTPQEPTPAAPAVANARLELTDAVNTTPAAPPDALVSRITEYLALGGLFNPEQMEHLNVRQLLMDCRAALAAKPSAAPDVVHPSKVAAIHKLLDDLAADKRIEISSYWYQEANIALGYAPTPARHLWAIALLERAAAPRPALSPDALLVQKILEDAANLLDDYWLHDAKGNLIATKGNLRAAILGLKSKYLRAPAPREGA